MTHKYPYTVSMLEQIIRSLASEEGDIRERLEYGYLRFHVLKGKDFPRELKVKWKWVIKEMTKSGQIIGLDGKEKGGSVHNTMSRIKNKTGTKIAEEICNIYWELIKRKKYYL